MIRQNFQKYWIVWSIVIAVLIGCIAMLAIESHNRSKLAESLGAKNLNEGEYSALKIMEHIDSKRLSSNDVEQLDRLTLDSDDKTRVMAFATVAHMANHGDRTKALQLLKRVETDKSPDIRKKKLWWHFVARCDDWRQLAQEGLSSSDPVLLSDAKLALENDPNVSKQKK